MTGRDLIALTLRSPFRPFVIETVNGQMYKVRHPDFVASFTPEPRTGSTSVIVAQENGPDLPINTLTVDRVVLLSTQGELRRW